MATDETVSFNVEKEKNAKTKEILKEVYDALKEKGYNPVNQIVGYILSGDPTYITSHNGARNLIRQTMSRILGIDYGQVRTGIAISDELQITAQGLETIVSNGSDKVLLRRIAEIVDEYKVDKIVIGNPINLDGTESERSIITDKFVHKLKSRFNKIEIIKIDERLTTVEAHRTMNFLNVKNREKKNLVDTVAATYILETYLNSIKKA